MAATRPEALSKTTGEVVCSAFTAAAAAPAAVPTAVAPSRSAQSCQSAAAAAADSLASLVPSKATSGWMPPPITTFCLQQAPRKAEYLLTHAMCAQNLQVSLSHLNCRANGGGGSPEVRHSSAFQDSKIQTRRRKWRADFGLKKTQVVNACLRCEVTATFESVSAASRCASGDGVASAESRAGTQPAATNVPTAPSCCDTLYKQRRTGNRASDVAAAATNALSQPVRRTASASTEARLARAAATRALIVADSDLHHAQALGNQQHGTVPLYTAGSETQSEALHMQARNAHWIASFDLSVCMVLHQGIDHYFTAF